MTAEKLPQQLSGANSGDPMISMIERVIMSPDVPVERITALIDIRERQMAKEAEQAFNAAFAAAMADMPSVPKSGENKHLGRKYSTLDDLIKTSRPVLANHGLALNWQTGFDGESIRVKAIVRHSLGHSIETEQSAPRDKSGSMNVLQGGGSTETYLKRYTGFAILGMASGDERDDDGHGSAPLINGDQYQVLSDLMEKAEADETKMLGFLRAQSLEELTVKQFDTAVSMLRKKIAQKGGAS